MSNQKIMRLPTEERHCETLDDSALPVHEISSWSSSSATSEEELDEVLTPNFDRIHCGVEGSHVTCDSTNLDRYDVPTRPISPWVVIDLSPRDSTFCRVEIRKFDLASSVADSAAEENQPDVPSFEVKSVPKQSEILQNVCLRGGALNADDRRMLFVGYREQFRNRLALGYISIDIHRHHYLGGARVQVRVRRLKRERGTSGSGDSYSSLANKAVEGDIVVDEVLDFEAYHDSQEVTSAKDAIRSALFLTARGNERLLRLANTAKSFILSASQTVWYNGSYWGIEISTPNVWTVSELCSSNWHRTDSEVAGVLPVTGAIDRTRADLTTSKDIASRTRDAMAAEICRQVWYDKEVRRLSNLDDDLEGPHASDGQRHEREAFEDVQLHLSSGDQDRILLSDQSLQGWPTVRDKLGHVEVEDGGWI